MTLRDRITRLHPPGVPLLFITVGLVTAALTAAPIALLLAERRAAGPGQFAEHGLLVALFLVERRAAPEAARPDLADLEEIVPPEPVCAAPDQAEIERLTALDSGVSARNWTHIIVHHSGTESGDAASFDRYHREVRGWSAVGYHFVIGNGTRTGDGAVEPTVRWTAQRIGAHCPASSMNHRAVGICFVGDFEQSSGPSPSQLAAGKKLVRQIARGFDIPPENILGHGEVPGAQTACPGTYFPLDVLREAAAAER